MCDPISLFAGLFYLFFMAVIGMASSLFGVAYSANQIVHNISDGIKEKKADYTTVKRRSKRQAENSYKNDQGEL